MDMFEVVVEGVRHGTLARQAFGYTGVAETVSEGRYTNKLVETVALWSVWCLFS